MLDVQLSSNLSTEQPTSMYTNNLLRLIFSNSSLRHYVILEYELEKKCI